MTPGLIAIFLLAAGLVLMLGELLLPTHGILGLLGLLSAGGAIAACFAIDRWLGLGVFLAAVASSPFLLTYGIRLWQRTAVGRRVILPPIVQPPQPPPVRIGATGRAVTELRPMGECEFAPGQRLESLSQTGLIPVGRPVRVVALDDRRPVVREIGAAAQG